MFTIEVKKKEKDEEFGFENLELFHKECLGGKLEQKPGIARIIGWPGHSWEVQKLTCTRCERKVWILRQSIAPSEIIKTAIDGQERKIEGYAGEEHSEYGLINIDVSQIDLVVIQKT